MTASTLSTATPKVTITSDFWNTYRQLIVKEVLPYQWAVMNDEADINITDEKGGENPDSKNSHAVANLKIAAGQMTGHHFGFPFQDTDVYKWLEAASYSFSYQPNPDLKQITDNLIDLIADAQEDDGYLSTFFQIDAPKRRFKRLQQSHELYTMGHYIEAGVAYHQATGNEKALTIAIKMADCIDANFGPADGKIHAADGHPEIELALAKLFEVTHEQRYLDLAHYFLVNRGVDPEFYDRQLEADGFDNDIIPNMHGVTHTYYQVDQPLLTQKDAKGHAVRVVYLCTGMAHVARLTGDKDLLAACERLWDSIVHRRMYVTGGIGSTNVGEAFTYDYDLPNETMYAETCASVGLTFFAKQMLQNEAKGEYGDIIEKELFNGALSGISLDGKHFFYVNPLTADPKFQQNPSKAHIMSQRQDWFGCACCPSNIARLVSSIDQYVYTVTDKAILTHQFIANKATFDQGLEIEQTSNFPWDNHIHYAVTNPNKVQTTLGIRIPSWSRSDFTVQVNGSSQTLPVNQGFIYLDVTGDLTVDLTLDFSIRELQANTAVAEDAGKVAIQRGPMVYCVEQADNPENLWNYRLAADANLQYHFNANILNGVGEITAQAAVRQTPQTDALYSNYQPTTWQPTSLTLVPYYAWANREDGQMRVWLSKENA
ncbi:glycoside hydrolase family 127 protein [Levilactobacillus cerevisiae]|uniref:glycoside hydrolase family 127 protein n=1 Tax=Levilactobacillus cerevisiae TaxID=1704076 RepID=UPI000F7951A2|nr:beta-L-arabinofuranosidase domain-containing protein [Levilactobacillus cerevisiae]